MTEIVIKDLERLSEAAAQFIDLILNTGKNPDDSAKNKGFGTVFAFRAPMGAGKTTLISEICRQLGCSDEANSPTFSIVNEYDTEKLGKVYHLDCYRLENEDEALEIGVEDYFYSGCPCFVEWPEKIETLLPADTIEVKIHVKEDGTRILTV